MNKIKVALNTKADKEDFDKVVLLKCNKVDLENLSDV